MKLYNTLGRRVQDLAPIKAGAISLYTCGPTVYHYMHIGNLRKAVFDDLLKRTLIASGYKVEHALNITDVGHLASDADEGEDKLEQESRLENKSVWDIAEYYTKHALADYDSLNILRPDEIIKATDCIDQEIDFIKGLEKKGFVYKGELAVYFDTSKLGDYGKLTGQKNENKQVAVRQEVVIDKSKKHPSDFALWLFTRGKHKNHAMRWDSPWGEGFPGWHIECSTIIKNRLGDQIDIHTGGVDHIGTHHTNEIAQSEALTGKPLASIWMHSEFLLVDGQKMSKSSGNTYRIVDIEDHGFDRLAYRLLVLQSHYRAQQNFTWQALKDASRYLKNLRAVADMRFQGGGTSSHDFDTPKDTILLALSEDLNSSEALAALSKFFDSVSDKRLGKDQVRGFTDFINWLDDLLGLDLGKSEDISKEHKAIIDKREAARIANDWKLSDSLRDQLETGGIALRDTNSGPIWYRL